MVQRIEYTIFAETPEVAQLSTANKLIGHVHRSDLSFRAFRDWLREQGIWNKDTLPTALDLFDIRMDKQNGASLGPWAEKFFAVDDPEDQKTLLFERLLDQNTLLVKYVMEALDMEGGGRLHSTYELHRMLTSYVYPGEHVGLPSFQAWIKWMVGVERLKLIGIRWGLTDLGKEVVPKLRMIDVDEFLEEEEEEAEAATEAAATAESAAAPPAETTAQPAGQAPDATASPAAPASGAVRPPSNDQAAADAPQVATSPASAKPAKRTKTRAKSGKAAPTNDTAATETGKATREPSKAAAARKEVSSEELPDLPPEAPPVDDAVFEKYAAQFEEPAAEAEPETPPDVVARPPARRQTVAPSQLVRASSIDVGCSRDPLDLADVIEALREHGRAKGLGSGSLLVAYGLETRLAKSEAARHLFLAGVLARLSVQRPDGALCDLLVERVGGLIPVAVLLERPEALAEVVVRWGFGGGDQASQAIRAALLDSVIGGRALTTKQDTPTLLAEAPTSEVLVGMLSQGVLRGASMTTAFWLAREMVKVEIWRGPAARDIAFVPNRNNRMMAYRLRLIDSHFASTSARMIDIARTLGRALPPNSVEAAAFLDLAPDDHLRFDCPLVPICQSPCGWQPTD
jgi:hypothetical protein